MKPALLGLEAVNALNHPTFGLADLNINLANFGRIGGTDHPPRLIQLGLYVRPHVAARQPAVAPVADGEVEDDKPRWFPGGDLLYFTSRARRFSLPVGAASRSCDQTPVGPAFPSITSTAPGAH